MRKQQIWINIREKEQVRRRETKKKKENRTFSTKAKYDNKYHKDIIATNATASSLAKKTKSLTTDTDRAHFNGKSGENEYSYGTPVTVGRIHA